MRFATGTRQTQSIQYCDTVVCQTLVKTEIEQQPVVNKYERVCTLYVYHIQKIITKAHTYLCVKKMRLMSEFEESSDHPFNGSPFVLT